MVSSGRVFFPSGEGAWCVAVSDFLSPAGSWTKLPRSLRMRDKRADFVVGSLGGHIVAIGGLGK